MKEEVSELDAILSFYKSEVYDLLAAAEEEETKYWRLSPEALYDEYVFSKGGEGSA